MRLVLCVILIALGVIMARAQAQPGSTNQAVDPSAEDAVEEGFRRQEERTLDLLERLEPSSDVLRPEQPATEVPDLIDEQTCFVIHTFELTSRDDDSSHQYLLKSLESFRGQCIGAESLRRMASILDSKLVETGFATSKVSLPQQNLATGKVIFHVHVGRVEEIQLLNTAADGTPIEEFAGAWSNAFPLRSGDVLNVRALEQGVENMQRLPSQIVTTRLEPGATADTSRVTIQRRVPGMRERVRGGLTLDNSGGRLLGRAQFSSYASLDNPLNINDIVTASVNSNAEQPEKDHRSQSFSLNYSVPYGYSLWTFTQSRNRFAQRVRGTTALFLSSGESKTSELRMAYILFRSASSKLGLFAAVSTRRANGFIEDLELLAQRRRLTYLEQGVSYKKLFRSASVDGSFALRSGKPWLDAEAEFLDAGDGRVTLRPDVWNMRVNYTKPFLWHDRSFQYSAGFNGQHTDDHTLSSDHMSIGGRYSVRGFDGEQSLFAENGYTLRNEISSPMRWIDTAATSLFVGIDIGRVWGPSDIRLIGNKLAGAAVGTRAQWKALQTDLTLASPIEKPDTLPTKTANFYASMTYAF